MRDEGRRRSWHPLTELRWAWRGLRQRGWSAALAVVLLAVVLAGNAVVFSVADALVFHRLPYPDSERLVEIRSTSSGTGRNPLPILAPDLIERWRAHTDLFTGVAGYVSRRGLFLLGDGPAEQVDTADVTTNLFDVLAVGPLRGRVFVEGDDRAPDGHVALLREDVARGRFGRPELALGQRIDSSGGPLFIVGIMSTSFGFPHTAVKVWRATEPGSPLTTDLPGNGLRSLARVQLSMNVELATKAVRARAPQVGAAVGRDSYVAELAQYGLVEGPARLTNILYVLMGGALCLLLAVCANLASLELLQAVRRSYAFAVQLALGGSRLSVTRVAAMESLFIVAVASVAGLVLAALAIDFFAALLPDVGRQTANAIDLDLRAFGFTVALAAATWLLASLPPAVLAGFGANLLSLLKLDDGTTASSRTGARLRRVLTAAEVAAAVCLVALGLMYARSYENLLRLDKGFDSSGIGELSFVMTPRQGALFPDRTDIVVDELSILPGVVAVPGAPPPGRSQWFNNPTLEVDGTPWTGERVDLARQFVHPDYFRAIPLPLRSGRHLDAGSGRNDVVVPVTLPRGCGRGRTRSADASGATRHQTGFGSWAW